MQADWPRSSRNTATQKSCRNQPATYGKLYDKLDEEESIDVILTDAKKTRVIAEAKIKNDRMDARVLADLVRADLVVRSYVPPKEIRMQRALLRECISLVESRTMI